MRHVFFPGGDGRFLELQRVGALLRLAPARWGFPLLLRGGIRASSLFTTSFMPRARGSLAESVLQSASTRVVETPIAAASRASVSSDGV